MNSENNNNGTVLGSVNPNPVPENGVETLGNVSPTPEMTNNIPNPVPEQPINPVPPVNPEPNFNQNVNPGINEAVNPTVGPMPVNVGPEMGPIPQPEINSGPQPTAVPVPPVDANAQSVPSIEPPIPPQPNVAPPIEPTPAYTNPQTINPNPTSGFENPNTIGTNPPMSFEPEKTPIKNKQKKIIFIVIILVVLAGVGFGTYYVLNYTNLLNKNTNPIDIKTKNIEINVGDSIPDKIEDLAVISNIEPSSCSFDTSEVDNSKAGVYEYTVSCNSLSNTGKITVIDNSKLDIELETIYKAKGETFTASEFVKNNNDVKLEFVDSSEIEEYLAGGPGTYSIKLKATVDNQSKEIEGKLVVLEYPLKGFYTCTGSAQTIENSKATETIGNKFVIVNGGSVVNGYGKVAYEVHTFNFSNATSEFAELITKYNNEGTLTINNVTGEVNIDEENKNIVITKELKNEDVVKKYGETNVKDYASIRDYYNKLNGSQTNGTYTCKYEKSN